jgi:hypothetical protein
MSTLHSALAALQLHDAFHYIDPADPGAVGAGKYWLDTSGDPYLLRRRNDTDDGWVDIGSSGTTIFERDWAYQRQTDQTIPDSTNTAVSFTASFLVDNGGYFSIGDPTKFTVPADGVSAGTYAVSATVRWTGSNTGIRFIGIRKNGTDFFAEAQIDSVGTSDLIMNCFGMVVLAEGDYVELIVEQESGGDLDIVSANFFAPVLRGHLIH